MYLYKNIHSSNQTCNTYYIYNIDWRKTYVILVNAFSTSAVVRPLEKVGFGTILLSLIIIIIPFLVVSDDILSNILIRRFFACDKSIINNGIVVK